MKIESLFYPYDFVLSNLQIILTRKGWVTLSINTDDGIIKAQSERSLFKKHKTLSIKIERIDTDITNVILRVNSNSAAYEKVVMDDETAEEKLLNTIDKYF